MGVDWGPELILNNELLDEAHVDLFRRLREIAGLLDGERPALEAALAGFAEALVEHLLAEERLMDETLYPERARHRSAHELYAVDLDRMREELRAHGLTPEVRDWIERRIPEWLRFHVAVNDAPFGAYLARRQKHPPGAARSQPGRRLS